MRQNPNTPEFWDKLLISTAEISKSDSITRDRISSVAKLIPNEKIKLLDVGAGYGFLEDKLNKKQFIKLFCLDISYGGLKKLKSGYIGGFVVASAKSIPFQNANFDFVCVLEVLEHLFGDEAMSALSEAHRVLKARGKLIVSVPLYDQPKDKHPSAHVRMYTQDLIVSEIVRSGFEVTLIKELFAFKVNYLLKKMINKLLKIKKTPNDIIIFARKK